MTVGARSAPRRARAVNEPETSLVMMNAPAVSNDGSWISIEAAPGFET